MCLGEFELKFRKTKTMRSTKLSLAVLTTLAIFIALFEFPCCLAGGGAESSSGEHDAAFLTFLVSK